MNYAESARTLSWVASIYALGDGFGLYMAKTLYGTLAPRTTISLAIICSIIGCLLYALAGSFADDMEHTASEIIRSLFSARVLLGVANGSIYLTQ